MMDRDEGSSRDPPDDVVADDTASSDAGDPGESTDSPPGKDTDSLPGKVTRLHEVATEMQKATTPAEIYDCTVEAGVDILGFDWCIVEIATEGYFEIRATSEQAPLEVGDRPITTDHGITGDAYRDSESSVIDDAHAHPDAEPTLEEFRSGLTVPLGERGVFQGIAAETEFFDETDLELAELLVSHTRGALARVETTQRLNDLHDATRELMAAETHQAVAQRGCDIAASTLDRPLTMVFSVDEGTESLVPIASTAPANEVFDDSAAVEPGESVLWRAFTEQKTVRDTGSGGFAGCETTPGDTTWAHLVVPLGNHGVVRISSPVQDAFDGTDVTLAETLAANIEAAFTRADREQKRRKQARQLERKNERLDQFASIVSHDLRNPLNVAMTRAELARIDDSDEHLPKVDDALERMETIIDETLSLAKQGKTVETTEPVSLRQVAEQSWQQVETAESTLELAATPTVQADAVRLRHVFENLFRNAVKHGGDGVTVTVGELADGFYVEDDGSGIPESERDQIFELGYSSDPFGTGFGLAIVREVVEAHGWAVHVVDAGTGGARFEITGVGMGG